MYIQNNIRTAGRRKPADTPNERAGSEKNRVCDQRHHVVRETGGRQNG